MGDLPKIPCPPEQLASYIAEHPDTPITEILEPFRRYEAQLRGVFAQDRQNPVLKDPYINLLPLFTNDTKLITTRARNLETESEEEKSRYIMELPSEKRREHGSPATVANMDEFRHNFNIFSESSLTEMDWSNVVAAGSSVVNCLLPVPDEFNVNKRKLREYYHEKFCPASDVDLFLYGLTHDQAIEKMKQIEKAVRDSVLQEVTVVRTKYAVTIASQYPVRHIQIVLRVYKSIGEILTGFDIDAAGGAFDGKQVYVTPRALGSFITQINHIDLSRRSPSYENRLSKYSHRNFEIYWPDLDRSRVDPTIYERSFQRTLGLARLLVLERLPTTSVREKYQNQRRQERGRPELYRNHFRQFGDIKSNYEDEVADWLSEEEVSNYHTFTIPYGQKFNAKKIEKLCYSRDLLLNAEWNQPKDRKVYLHRHPAFFGRVQDVVEDCCGSCPVASTNDEKEVAEKEAEIYISGKVKFLIDDPGRQQIGSFNPLTDEDWTDMAYVGNTARLCQSIVDNDIDDVLNWLSQEGADPNRRDYTGRTPLHLAVMSSTADMVKCLVDHGARLTARLADGRTALHLASSRGDVDMVKILMEKSIENEAHFEDSKGIPVRDEDEHSRASDEDSDLEMVDSKTETDVMSVTTASFVKVNKSDSHDDEVISDEAQDEPDYYQIDVLAWDMPCSPLHLAIVEGHEGVVTLLCDYGADAILPVKFLQENDNNKAILTLVLALKLPKNKAISMVKLLLKLGAVSSQADTNSWTAFHKYVDNNEIGAIDVLLDNDKTAVKAAINHLAFSGYSWNCMAVSPLQTAIESENSILIMKLLTAGASPSIDFEGWLKAAKLSSMYNDLSNFESNKRQFASSVEQPLITAIRYANADLVAKLLDRGIHADTLNTVGNKIAQSENFQTWERAETALDLTQRTLRKLRAYKPKDKDSEETYATALGDCEAFLAEQPEDSYKMWLVRQNLASRKTRWEARNDYLKTKDTNNATGRLLKAEAIKTAIGSLEKIELMLISKGAKSFKELYPKYQYTGGADSDNFDRYDHIYGQPQELEPYQFSPKFVGDSDMTPARLEGYMELMTAAWTGDTERIKQLTLQPWGTNGSLMPLKADIADDHGNSPFSVAFLRGHHNAVRRILEIVQVQWSPKETEEVRYKLREDDEDEDEYEDSDCESYSQNSDQDIVAEKLNQPFTIDNVGEVSIQVKSHAKPVELLTRNVNVAIQCNDNSYREHVRDRLTRHVLDQDDLTGLKLLIELGQQYSGANSDDDDDEGIDSVFVFPVDDFTFAVQEGRVDLLKHLIKRTGAGLPLDHLIRKSGVQIKKKPRYYQGLTVYGKKRNDWATAGRNMVTRAEVSNTPPLLHAAKGGSIDSVEFFMGDAPNRLYVEFTKSKAGREDKRLDVLRKSTGGVDRAVSKWLGADNEWVLHCAIFCEPSEAAAEVVQYLINTCPAALEKKTSSGATPLMLACSLGRVDSIKKLIKAGADQSTKNHSGENILHALLAGGVQLCGVEAAFKLLDPELRSQLFLQRTNLSNGGNTPLQQWLSQRGRNDSIDSCFRETRMLKMILKYSAGKELSLLNSSGESCLHWAIRTSRINIVQALVDFNPALLVRENAVGRTPAEIAHEKVLSSMFVRPSGYHRYNHHESGVSELLRRRPDSFSSSDAKANSEQHERLLELQASTSLRDEYEPKILAKLLAILGLENVEASELETPGDDIRTQVTWDICRTTLANLDGKRRLVSLNEANDVARRLGESHSQSRYFSVETRHDEDEEPAEEDESKKRDYVSSLESTMSYSRWILPKRDEKPPKCTICETDHHADDYA